MRDLGTILGVWAHPDDEGYLSAGIMAQAMRNGQRVVCVTATAVRRPIPNSGRRPNSPRSGKRSSARALAILGVKEHRWLDYPDGGCAAIDPDTAAARIAAMIDEIGADTVLTFGPDGQTGHPDHIAVSDWCVRAVPRATGTPRSTSRRTRLEWAYVRRDGRRARHHDGRGRGAGHAARRARDRLHPRRGARST